MGHISTYFFSRFIAKYTKIALTFHLRQAVFIGIEISSFVNLHVAGKVSKLLDY